LNKPGPITVTPAVAPLRQQPPSAAPEGSTESGKALAEVARLSPHEALQRLTSTPAGLAPGQVEEQLRSVGPNRVARQARHTVLGELVVRSINPLNILLLSLATASYFLGDQRAAIMIAIMVILSITLGFLQEHRSNKAADELQKMVSITASVRRQGDADHVDIPIDQLVPGDIVLLSAGGSPPTSG
jgi:P-type Mg2+ transporter